MNSGQPHPPLEIMIKANCRGYTEACWPRQASSEQAQRLADKIEDPGWGPLTICCAHATLRVLDDIATYTATVH